MWRLLFKRLLPISVISPIGEITDVSELKLIGNYIGRTYVVFLLCPGEGDWGDLGAGLAEGLGGACEGGAGGGDVVDEE